MYKVITGIELFRGIEEEELTGLLNSITMREKRFKAGALIGHDGISPRALCIILDGKIEARKYLRSGKVVYLKPFGNGDVFGAGNLFSRQPIRLSYIEVIRDSRICIIEETEILKLFELSKQVLINYLAMMSSKVQYLNHKIDILSQNTIEERLIFYIEEQQQIQGSSSITINHSKSELAELLGISRTSLYRVIDELTSRGVFNWKKNKVYFPSDKIF